MSGKEYRITPGGIMQHLLPLYIVSCILPGIAALTVLSISALRMRNRGLTYFLISYFCFTVSIIINLLMFYLGINISNELSSGIFILISLGIPFSILMQTALPLAVNEVTVPPGKRWINTAIILIAVIELILFSTPLLMRYVKDTMTIRLGPLFPFVGILQTALIAYSIAMIIIRRRTITNLTIRRYILTITAIIIFFLPAIAYDQFYFTGVESIDAVPVTIILSPFFYGILSLATLYFGIRALMARSTPAPQGNLEETAIRNLAGSSGLSEREITIIRLMAKGLGNKQIALELHISSKTVGNHIYNIYRKLNITSRFELIALMK